PICGPASPRAFGTCGSPGGSAPPRESAGRSGRPSPYAPPVGVAPCACAEASRPRGWGPRRFAPGIRGPGRLSSIAALGRARGGAGQARAVIGIVSQRICMHPRPGRPPGGERSASCLNPREVEQGGIMREARGCAGAPEDSRGASGAGPDDSLDRLERATRRTTDERDDLLAQNRQLRALLEAIEIERGRLAAVSEFLATMSHELRTPLLALNGLVELLETEVAGALNAEQKKMLVRMHTAGDHLVEVIDQILDFSRFEGAERGALIVEVDAASLCASVADMLAEGAVARGLALELQMPDVPVVVRTDPCWLRQIVTNLLANAIRYTD